LSSTGSCLAAYSFSAGRWPGTIQGGISDKHSYEVERDYWEWEAAMTDEERLQEMLESLP
jgi:hypothetical protein